MSSGASASRGRLVLGAEVGSTEHGTVHVAKIVGAGGFARRVSVKRVRMGFTEEAEAPLMLLDEARLASRIHHPNVVPVHDVLREGDDVLIVMDFVRGVPLSTLLERARAAAQPIALPVAVAILVDMLRGLHAAHEVRGRDGASLGLVHRSVSPRALLVSDSGVSRVVDLGLAKAEGRLQRTKVGQVKGAPEYMAPEQISGGVVDRRADVYGAGRVLLALLALREERGVEALRRTRAVPAFGDVTRRATSADPAARFATAKEFADTLENTVSPARPRDVATWMAPLVRPDLEALDALVGSLEREASPGILLGLSSASGLPGEATRPRRAGVALWFAAAACLGALGAVGAATLVAPPRALVPAPSAAIGPEAHAEASGHGAAPESVPSASSQPVASAPPPSAQASAAPDAPRPTRPMVVRAGPASAEATDVPRATGCDPPYVIQPDGIRVLRRECLRQGP